MPYSRLKNGVQIFIIKISFCRLKADQGAILWTRWHNLDEHEFQAGLKCVNIYESVQSTLLQDSLPPTLPQSILSNVDLLQ